MTSFRRFANGIYIPSSARNTTLAGKPELWPRAAGTHPIALPMNKNQSKHDDEIGIVRATQVRHSGGSTGASNGSSIWNNKSRNSDR